MYYCKNFEKFLQNFCKFFCTIFANFLQIDMGFGHEVPIFLLMLLCIRGFGMRDQRPLLLLQKFLHIFYKKFTKYFAKFLKQMCRIFCKMWKKKIFFCVKFWQNFGKFKFYTQILDHVNSLASARPNSCNIRLFRVPPVPYLLYRKVREQFVNQFPMKILKNFMRK